MRLAIKLGAFTSVWLAAAYTQAERVAVLPPDNAPVAHWPWWLRILAVLAVLAFVQIVARSLRRGTSRRGPGSTDNS